MTDLDQQVRTALADQAQQFSASPQAWDELTARLGHRRRSWIPAAVAAAVLLPVASIVAINSHHSHSQVQPADAGLSCIGAGTQANLQGIPLAPTGDPLTVGVNTGGPAAICLREGDLAYSTTMTGHGSMHDVTLIAFARGPFNLATTTYVIGVVDSSVTSVTVPAYRANPPAGITAPAAPVLERSARFYSINGQRVFVIGSNSGFASPPKVTAHRNGHRSLTVTARVATVR